MKKGQAVGKKTVPDSKMDLREQTERISGVRKPGNRNVTVLSKENLLHELEVYQIELEMQNEELRRSKQKLQESRRRYADLFDFTPVGYFILDAHFLIVEANLTGIRMLGLERQRAIGQKFTQFIAPSFQDNFYRFLGIEKDRPERKCELEMNRKEAGPFYTELRVTTINPAKSGPHYRVAVSDITNRKQAEEKLLSTQLELETVLRELEKSNEQLKYYNKKLIQIQENEKEQTSKALDDTIQYLSILRLEMGNLLNKETNITPAMNAKLRELFYSTTKKLEAVSGKNEKLEPGLLEQIGVVEALQLIVEQFGMLNNIHIDFKFNTSERLSNDCELALFRIAQEALDNIAKHSKATLAEVKLTINPEEVNLAIRDNGQGFDTTSLSSNMSGGINLEMAERARLIGAALTVTSLIGNGTTVSIKAPCKKCVEEI